MASRSSPRAAVLGESGVDRGASRRPDVVAQAAHGRVVGRDGRSLCLLEDLLVEGVQFDRVSPVERDEAREVGRALAGRGRQIGVEASGELGQQRRPLALADVGPVRQYDRDGDRPGGLERLHRAGENRLGGVVDGLQLLVGQAQDADPCALQRVHVQVSAGERVARCLEGGEVGRIRSGDDLQEQCRVDDVPGDRSRSVLLGGDGDDSVAGRHHHDPGVVPGRRGRRSTPRRTRGPIGCATGSAPTAPWSPRPAGRCPGRSGQKWRRAARPTRLRRDVGSGPAGGHEATLGTVASGTSCIGWSGRA